MEGKNMKNKKESGQIIVLLAVALVGLLAIASLAVDVGLVSADRRYAQSVADSSALAGAGIPVFVISTYRYDHILVPLDRQDEAVRALMREGFERKG